MSHYSSNQCSVHCTIASPFSLTKDWHAQCTMFMIKGERMVPDFWWAFPGTVFAFGLKWVPWPIIRRSDLAEHRGETLGPWSWWLQEDDYWKKLLDHDGCRRWLLEANDGSAAQMSEDHSQVQGRLLRAPIGEVLAGERKCPSIENCLTFTFHPVSGVGHKDLWMCKKV